MNICLLIKNFPSAGYLVNELVRAGYQVSIVCIREAKDKGLKMKLGQSLPFYFFYNLLKLKVKSAGQILSWPGTVKIIKYSGSPNAERLSQILKALKPDLIIQKVGFILKDNILKTPKIGVLNDHIAKLPFFRGRRVLEWAVLHGKETGSTVHFIDRGVDTGAILKVYNEDIRDLEDNLKAKNHLFGLSDKKLIEIVEMISRNSIEPLPNQPEDGKQFFDMHPRLVKYVNNLLADNYYSDKLSGL